MDWKEIIESKIEQKVMARLEAESGDKEEYEKFFQAALKKFGVESPAELDDEKKKEFFNYVDANWKGDNEKAEDLDETEASDTLEHDAKAKKKELAEYISCFKGYISDEELAVWLHKSNIHLSTCTPLELFALKRHKFLELYVKTTEKYKLYETIFSNVNDKTQQ